MWTWILLLCAVVFFLYLWNTRNGLTAPAAPGCNTCPHKKNVSLE